MNIIDRLNRPEYIFRPTQIYKRLSRPKGQQTNKFENVTLPWGANITIRPAEVLGRSIWIMGVYDLSVTEILWRLIDRGEIAVDIGANVGYMTSVMANRLGEKGKIYSFEPHPETYKELCNNCQEWMKISNSPCINTFQMALSDRSGEGTLLAPVGFEQNRGIATLASSRLENNSEQLKFFQHSVTLSTLDEIISSKEHIGVVKIDVEGHELSVLSGATRLIYENKIRDIIFEDNREYPTTVTQYLEEKGYHIFQIVKGFFKPLLSLSSSKNKIQYWESQSYLATKDVARAKSRLSTNGWFSLSKCNNSQIRR